MVDNKFWFSSDSVARIASVGRGIRGVVQIAAVKKLAGIEVDEFASLGGVMIDLGRQEPFENALIDLAKAIIKNENTTAPAAALQDTIQDVVGGPSVASEVTTRIMRDMEMKHASLRLPEAGSSTVVPGNR